MGVDRYAANRAARYGRLSSCYKKDVTILEAWENTALGALVTAFVGGTIAAIKRLYTRQKAVSAGLQAILYDRIFTIGRECEDKGYATIEEKRNLEYLYRPYHALGGNGTGTQLYKKVLAMPDRPEQEAV
jgi:hypothetical protein